MNFVKKIVFFSLLTIVAIIMTGCSNIDNFSNQEFASISSAEKSCKEYHRKSIISNIAPDGLEMFDDDPYNDPQWDEPTISFSSYSEEQAEELTITLDAELSSGSNYECKCFFTKTESLFWDKYQQDGTEMN